MTVGRWWHDAVGYEVYLPSFADSDGDGVGDLRGLHGRLEYLAWLGAGIVWITPFYPSPMRDHGYDVSDYTDVDERFGDLDDLDAVVSKGHGLGLRVIIDLVPNHTSSEHVWFREARSSRQSPYRDYYIWRDPAPDGGPPNNWASHFGGPAWTYDERTAQYWLHLFLPDQPDLNWRNPAVVEEFDRILRFWLDRGVDGFRIDVAHALMKHADLLDLPPAPVADPDVAESKPMLEHAQLEHVHDIDQPEVLDVYRRWRTIAEPYDALLLGEVYLLEADRLARYLVDRDGLDLSFWFGPMHVEWSAAQLLRTLREGADAAPGAVAWVLASHDRPRPATRFGGGDLGRACSLAFATLFSGLPGTPFLYQGEELGLTDGELAPGDAQDPVARYTGDVRQGRDGARTPMPWEPGEGLGFTTAARPWLPLGGRGATDTVAEQRAAQDSWLNRYRALLALRRELADLRRGPLTWLTCDGPVIAYRRGDALVAANCGDVEAAMGMPGGSWRVRFATGLTREGTFVSAVLRLAPAEAVVLSTASRG